MNYSDAVVSFCKKLRGRYLRIEGKRCGNCFPLTEAGRVAKACW